jgi:hypothetical protein
VSRLIRESVNLPGAIRVSGDVLAVPPRIFGGVVPVHKGRDRERGVSLADHKDQVKQGAILGASSIRGPKDFFLGERKPTDAMRGMRSGMDARRIECPEQK